jgi:fatty-acid desaturase
MIEPAPAPRLPPWDRPWWYVDGGPGQRDIFLYLIAIHALALVGLALYPVPTTKVVVAFLISGLGGLGTTIGYHRVLAHRSVRVHPVVEQALIVLALFNGSGPPRQWVANHRRHHATADSADDVSSPHGRGFWWAHLRWMYQMPNSDPARWSPDMNRPRYDVWTRFHVIPFAVSLTWGFAFGWEGFFWLGPLRLAYSTHMQCLVNSVAHMGGPGRRDRSLNVWWLGPLQLTAWGENWHRNHHDDPASARFSRAWYQLDFGWYVIRALEAAGLAERPRCALHTATSLASEGDGPAPLDA